MPVIPSSVLIMLLPVLVTISSSDYTDTRLAMVSETIESRGVTDPLTLEAMETVPDTCSSPRGHPTGLPGHTTCP